jgi:hypothetical protein
MAIENQIPTGHIDTVSFLIPEISVESIANFQILADSQPVARREIPPLDFIPSSYERRQKMIITGNRLHTAHHELHHVLTAIGLGVQVESLSVIPSGSSLGRTTFSGFIDPEKFRIIAAAGAVDPPGMRASGYGHDLWQAGCDARSTKIITAQNIISEIPSDIRNIAAEIIAYLGDVPGSLIPEIINRAIYEHNHDVSAEDKYFIPDNLFAKPETIPENRITTIVTTIGNNYLLTYLLDGKIVKDYEVIICAICGGIQGQHLPNCGADLVRRRKIGSDKITENSTQNGLIGETFSFN